MRFLVLLTTTDKLRTTINVQTVGSHFLFNFRHISVSRQLSKGLSTFWSIPRFFSALKDLKYYFRSANKTCRTFAVLLVFIFRYVCHAMRFYRFIRLVSEMKLRRIQRRKYRELQAKLFELWDQYEAKERSAKSLLEACSHLNGPRES